MDGSSGEGIGHSVPRKEDGRYLRGRGRFIADIRPPGTQDLAFVRSPLAHARIGAIRKPPGQAGRVFTMADLAGVGSITANSTLPGFKPSSQPPLATGRVRHVGEAIAVCVAPTRAEAEDIAEAVDVDLEELPAVTDMLAARAPGAPLLHAHWGDNVFLGTSVDIGDPAVRAQAAIVIRRSLRTARQHMAPIEGRGLVAEWDPRLEQLVLHTASQMPHIIRTGLAECLGICRRKPSASSPRTWAAASATRASCCRRRWSPPASSPSASRPSRPLDRGPPRRRSPAPPIAASTITTSPPTRASDGRLLALDAEATVDAGAYSIYPFSACLEAAQIASILPGPVRFRRLPLPDLVRRHQQACHPALSRRRPRRRRLRHGNHHGRHRPRETGLEPHEVRLRNLIPSQRHAVRQHHRQAFRQRRLPGMPPPHRPPPSTSPPSAPRRPPRSLARNASASAWRSSASRRRTAPASTPAGASPWCRGSSRPPPGCPRMAAWNCASASNPTARGWKPRWRRWRIPSWACRCRPHPRRARRYRASRPTPRGPGAPAAWSWPAARSPAACTELAARIASDRRPPPAD